MPERVLPVKQEPKATLPALPRGPCWPTGDRDPNACVSRVILYIVLPYATGRMSKPSGREWDLPEAAATAESDFVSRRRFMQALVGGTAVAAGGVVGGRRLTRARIDPADPIERFTTSPSFTEAGRPLTRDDVVYRFNNFYEFTHTKSASARLARTFRIDPWSLTIDGQVEQPSTVGLEEVLKLPLEQRVYRFRCVEAWAMTVPWIGVPLSTLLKRVTPTRDARFIQIQSFLDPQQAPRQQDRRYPWPYTEGLTIEEAMNPLAFAAIGIYGRHLQPQNGAPFRIVLPWKYGYKGPKSVVRITYTNSRPATFWNALQPNEYGFVGNVNPDLPHPRWSQKREALLGHWGRRVATQKFNGYGRWVSHLYESDEY